MFDRRDFPRDFVFGAATAAYQIESHRVGGAGPTHWDSFAATPGNVVGTEDGAIACDHYHRWPEDLDLLRDGGFDAYRFSTSWARVMPDGRTVNPEGLDFYDRLVDGILERGLTPFLTLYHWELPSALADQGGWMNRDTTARFGDFARLIGDKLGDRVAKIATINEPWCVSWLSHFEGHHAPGLRDIRAAARSMHHIMLAHAEGMEALRAAGHQGAGIVLNFTDVQCGESEGGWSGAAARTDAIMNRWFIESVARGEYPAEALEGLERHLPKDWAGDMARIAAPIDWLGVNYYSRALVTEAPETPWPSTGAIDGPLAKTQMGWEIYPLGLSTLLNRMADDYLGALPIYVTENGMAWPDQLLDEKVEDFARIDYVAAHLQEVLRSLSQGANIKGYFYWSLLDNYEWSFGYEKRFGLVHVDFDTLTRTPKASWHRFQEALSGRR